MESVPHVIDGQETESSSGERFASVDPWTREPRAVQRGIYDEFRGRFTAAQALVVGTQGPSREFFTEPKAVVMQL